MAGLVIVGTVIFNPILAIVNGHVTGLNDKAVIACEVSLFAAALLLALRGYQRAMLPWFVFIVIAGMFALLRLAGTGVFEPKYLRDALLVPTFILLGMTVSPYRITRTIVIVTAIAVACEFFEAFFLDSYRDLFQVQDYYVATRGYSPEQFWDTEVALFPSAFRDDRMLSFVQLHRLSSVFLEPVSLGNYCAVLFAYLLAWGRNLPRRTYVFLMASVIVLLVGCDGRLAFVGMVLIFGVSIIAPFLPRFSAALYLPAAVIAVCLLTWWADLNPDGNDFPSRLALTAWLMQSFGPMEFLGLSDQFAEKAADSGIAYWISTQSLLGVSVMWLFVMIGSRQETTPQVRYLHAVALYLSVTMLVSASYASIKTAALMWFILGALQNDVVPRVGTTAAQAARMFDRARR